METRKLRWAMICSVLLAFIATCASATEAEIQKRILNYSMTSGNKSIGQIEVTEKSTGLERTHERISEINFTELGEDYLLVIHTKAASNDRRISGFDHWIVDKNEQWHLSGKILSGALWVSAYQAKGKDDKDIEDLISLAKGVASYTTDHAGIVRQVLDLFSGEEQEGEKTVPLDSYDTTDMGLYEYLLQQEKWAGTRKIKMFATEILELETIKVDFLGQKKQVTDAGSYNCTGFSIQAKDMNTTLWLTDQDDWGATLVKEEGVYDGLPVTTVLHNK